VQFHLFSSSTLSFYLHAAIIGKKFLTQLVKTFSALCVTSKFIAISTTARHRNPPAPDDTTPHLHILHCHAVIFASYNSTAKMSQTRYPETSATSHPVRRRHIPHQRPHPAILCLCLSVGRFFSSGFPAKGFRAFVVSTARAACSTLLLFLHWSILIIFRG
jgi:hypothetical protein